MDRRQFLATVAKGGVVGATSLAFAGLLNRLPAEDPPDTSTTPPGFGPLVQDPEGVIDLPEGFSYQLIGRTGEIMADGQPTPPMPDGMAAIPLSGSLIALICNHEALAGTGGAFRKHPQAERIFDDGGGRRPGGGGTSTIIWDQGNQTVVRRFLSLAGTTRNCAGGSTPWGSWLSCEEDITRAGTAGCAKDHGWVFEVPATENPELTVPVPLTAMGRFNHEAAAVNPASGTVYLSEDRGDGLFYRFLPKTPGKLAEGGKLQALAIPDQPGYNTAANHPVGERWPVRWIDLDEVEAPKDDLRHRGRKAGAAVFRRGEGLWMDGSEACYLACTNGGRRGLGQLWRYLPEADELELVYESSQESDSRYIDNVTVSPWGDLLACEDGPPGNRLIGITANGKPWHFAQNRLNGSEFAGTCFSPDGRTAFVNIQFPGLTYAITGPFPKASTGS
jgi:secreted PhoX family phosphatase